MLTRLVLVLVSSGLFLTLSSCNRNNSPEIIRPQPLPQDELIKVYFNQNQAEGANYTDPYRNIDRSGDNLEQIIINNIEDAQETIEIAVQEFRLPKIAQSLAKKQQNGVNIRVIIENDYRRPFSDYSPEEIKQLTGREKNRLQAGFNFIDLNRDGRISQEESKKRDALIILENAGIPILDDTADGTKGSGLMHHKFMIVDGKISLVASNNFTLSGIHGDLEAPNTRGNANNLVTIRNSELASIFQEEFDLMWGDGVGKKPDSVFGVKKGNRMFPPILVGESAVSVHFSPLSKTQSWQDSSNGFIGEQLAKAETSVNFALFVFSEQKIADILAKGYEREVNINGLIEPSFAYRYYSEGLDMLGVALARNCKFEKNNNPWEAAISTVGIPQLPEGDLLHHKFAVVDEKVVITGSHNWSASANYQNDETVLVIENPTVAAHYQREFERLYDRSVLGIPQWLQERVKEQEKECS